jgi:hypothetical protein
MQEGDVSLDTKKTPARPVTASFLETVLGSIDS